MNCSEWPYSMQVRDQAKITYVHARCRRKRRARKMGIDVDNLPPEVQLGQALVSSLVWGESHRDFGPSAGRFRGGGRAVRVNSQAARPDHHRREAAPRRPVVRAAGALERCRRHLCTINQCPKYGVKHGRDAP